MSLINPLSGATGRRLLIAFTILLGSIAAAAPSQAHAATYELQPVELHVHDIEDWWPDWIDEARLYYGGQSWPGSVRTGQVVPGDQLPRARFTGTQIEVFLKENDRGTDYLLGRQTITNLVDEHRSAFFGDGRDGGCLGAGYCYELKYVVKQVG